MSEDNNGIKVGADAVIQQLIKRIAELTLDNASLTVLVSNQQEELETLRGNND